jgi:hypothetical protein
MDAARQGELKAVAASFLSGELRPLEAALALSRFRDEVPGELQTALLSMVGVASETDDILLGHRRQLWHPDVRAKENRKHDEAQAWAEPIVRKACEHLIEAL